MRDPRCVIRKQRSQRGITELRVAPDQLDGSGQIFVGVKGEHRRVSAIIEGARIVAQADTAIAARHPEPRFDRKCAGPERTSLDEAS